MITFLRTIDTVYGVSNGRRVKLYTCADSNACSYLNQAYNRYFKAAGQNTTDTSDFVKPIACILQIKTRRGLILVLQNYTISGAAVASVYLWQATDRQTELLAGVSPTIAKRIAKSLQKLDTL